MKTITKSLKTLFIGNLAIFLLYGVQPVKAELKPKERNILANEARATDLAKAVITDNKKYM